MKISLRSFSLFLVVYNVFVILWGAWVRISHSGDGCGKSWPLCEGQIVPKATEASTWIEYTHRLSTGIYGVLILVLVYWVFKRFSKGHIARKWSMGVLIFTIIESLIGALLVLAGLVADNESIARAYVMAIHLISSLLLTGFLFLTWQSVKSEKWSFSNQLGFRKRVLWSLWTLFLCIGATGAIAALSGTLFPSESLLAGFMADFSENSHFLVRLRVSHPMLATIGVIAMMWFAYICHAFTGLKNVKTAAMVFMVILVVALLLGYITLFSLSPLSLKILHLSMAHVLWMAFINLIFVLFYRSGRWT